MLVARLLANPTLGKTVPSLCTFLKSLIHVNLKVKAIYCWLLNHMIKITLPIILAFLWVSRISIGEVLTVCMFHMPVKRLLSSATETRGISSVLQQRGDNGSPTFLLRLGWHARQCVLERQLIVVVYCVYHLTALFQLWENLNIPRGQSLCYVANSTHHIHCIITSEVTQTIGWNPKYGNFFFFFLFLTAVSDSRWKMPILFWVFGWGFFVVCLFVYLVFLMVVMWKFQVSPAGGKKSNPTRNPKIQINFQET